MAGLPHVSPLRPGKARTHPRRSQKFLRPVLQIISPPCCTINLGRVRPHPKSKPRGYPPPPLFTICSFPKKVCRLFRRSVKRAAPPRLWPHRPKPQIQPASHTPRAPDWSTIEWLWLLVTLPTAIQPRSPQGGFANEPFTDFKDPENARDMQAALDLVAAQLGREYDLIIGGHRLKNRGQNPLPQSRAPRAGRRHPSESRRRARRAGHAGRAQRL